MDHASARRVRLVVAGLMIAFAGSSRAQETQPEPPAELQPPVQPQPQPRTTPPPRTTSSDNAFLDWLGGPPRARRRASTRVASVPDMFGDSQFQNTFDVANGRYLLNDHSFVQYGQEIANNGAPIIAGTFLAGGRNKLAENGGAMAKNRVYFDARFLQNSLDVATARGARARNTQRYTFGIEKVFGENADWSAELRLPINGGNLVRSNGFAYDAEGFGNLSLILKHELTSRDDFVTSAGLGLVLPTGRDSQFHMPQVPLLVELENEAVFLQPFLGFVATPHDDVFVQGFLQFDFNANGNRVVSRGPGFANTNGRLNDQNLVFVDAEFGYWFCRGNGDWLDGLAGIVELHYTSTLNDADFVQDNSVPVVLGNADNRIDLLNLTLGLHALVHDGTAIRLGVVVPLKDRPNRVFDTETVLTVIQRY